MQPPILVRLNPGVILALGGDVVPAAPEGDWSYPYRHVGQHMIRCKRDWFAASLHPGGNITGVTLILDELAGKHLKLLKEMAPR